MQFGQPPRQRQPEPGALATAGDAAIDLTKRLEGDLDFRRGHAQSGIAHLEFDAAIGSAAHDEADGAAWIGEFDRVAEQIQQDLLEPGRIGHQRRHRVVDFDRKAQGSGERALSDQGDAGIGQAAHIDPGVFFEFEFSGVDLRQVEDLVDDVEQMRPALPDIADIFLLARVQRPGRAPLQHLGETENRIERSAQLVAHIGEKSRFGQARRLRFGLGRLQVALRPHLLADVARGSTVAAKLPRSVENRLAADRDDVLRLGADLAPIDEAAKGLAPIQGRPMLAPLLRFAASVGCKFPAGAA